jgi:hypothetical protein
MSNAGRAARANWEIAITRGSNPTGAAQRDEDDDAFWLKIPLNERAKATWDLSRELYSLAARNRGVFDEETGTFAEVSGDDLERRLPRAAFVITRR